MITLNSIDFPERHDRPNVGDKLALRALFYNDGVLIDPNDVSGVTVFKYSDYSTSNVLDSNNLVSATPIFHFEPSGTDQPHDAADYGATWGGGTDFENASGIFKLGTGDFVAPLRLDKALSGVYEGVELEASSAVSAATTYVDIWTVKLLAGSNYQVFINTFSLYEDTFLMLTEPLIAKATTKLLNKHLRYGEIVDLKFPVEVTVQNKNISQAIINTLKTTLIQNPAVKIVKVNDNPSLDGPFTVSGYSDTSSTVTQTADGTIVWNFDTTNLDTLTGNTFGEARGTYKVHVQYTLNSDTIISPPFYFTID